MDPGLRRDDEKARAGSRPSPGRRGWGAFIGMV